MDLAFLGIVEGTGRGLGPDFSLGATTGAGFGLISPTNCLLGCAIPCGISLSQTKLASPKTASISSDSRVEKVLFLDLLPSLFLTASSVGGSGRTKPW